MNTTQFTIVNALCMRGLPITDPDHVVYLGTRNARDQDGAVSYRDFKDLRRSSRSFAGIAAFTEQTTAVAEEGHAPDRVTTAFISANAFELLGESPALGRSFRADDDRPGAVRSSSSGAVSGRRDTAAINRSLAGRSGSEKSRRR